jgi:dephospho-CoA kinase
MKKILFIIGASGAGKTTVARLVEKAHIPNLVVYYADAVKVPLLTGSAPEEMQKESTLWWVKDVRDTHLNNHNILLDIQSRPQFIQEACSLFGITDYEVILFDCSDEERKRRLIERKQPELANDDMANWARYLRKVSVESGYQIVDTTKGTPEENFVQLLGVMGK